MRVSKEVKDKCNTIEELLDVATDNGRLKYADIGNSGQDYSSFLRRYEYFKQHVKEKLPELTTEEVLKFDEHYRKFKEVVYAFNDSDRFLQVMEFEQYKKQQNHEKDNLEKGKRR